MSIASGFSIQRNDVINVPHRAQTETHTAYAGEEQYYVLRSKPDYANDEWESNGFGSMGLYSNTPNIAIDGLEVTGYNNCGANFQTQVCSQKVI